MVELIKIRCDAADVFSKIHEQIGRSMRRDGYGQPLRTGRAAACAARIFEKKI